MFIDVCVLLVYKLIITYCYCYTIKPVCSCYYHLLDFKFTFYKRYTILTTIFQNIQIRLLDFPLLSPLRDDKLEPQCHTHINY